MTPIDEFTTARLIARRICDDDFGYIARLYADARVMATLGGVMSEEQARERLAAMVEHWKQHGYGVWTLHTREDGRFAGRAGLRDVQIDGSAETELLYALRPEFWGKGIATEIARAVVRIAFDRLRIATLIAYTLPDNRASRRVMEKAGFRFEREITWAGLPHVLYRIARSD
ncbi:MAG TPA: GNAT family N-acetyltransferase [Candidatus Binataceae bacterium]|nr:GNAT family N-acetyltransferase [Candidatus Binataceae bacterium]